MALVAEQTRLMPTKLFKPGQSGNPSGKAKQSDAYKAFVQACRDYSPTALLALQKLIERGGKESALAAKTILAYAWGQPNQDINITGELATYVARLPQVTDNTSEWIMIHNPRLLSGSQTPDPKPPS